MKKCISILLCLLLACMLAVPALAADGIQFSMSASDNSLYRGDTVTITVSVSGNLPCTQYGLKLSINSDVYEVVEGKCTASGAMFTSYDPDKGFAVLYSSPTTPSGTVGTITLKVKEDAAFGSANVSGTASAKLDGETVESSGASAKLTVVCRHQYGSWSNNGTENHKRTCSICGGTDTADHTWNSGKIIKEPTCIHTGTKQYTCTVTGCGATYEETLPKTDIHTYGKWTKFDDTVHKHACTVCGKEESDDHRWDGGKVTTPANCLNTGIKTFTCTTCSGTRTEVIPKTNTHTYGSWQKVNETTHKHACTVCSKEETAGHSWNSGALTKKATCREAGERLYTCTACNSTRSEVVPKLTTHTYGPWKKVNDTTHTHACTVCNASETANHSWNTGVEVKKATCQEGGIKRYTCTGCGTTRDETTPKSTVHTYDNNCDTNCNVCNAVRTVTHTYKTNWASDANGHWHECSGCGSRKDDAAHIPGPAATATSAQTCTACGYILAPAQAHTHNYAGSPTFDGEGHWYPCDGCNERSEYAVHEFDHDCDADCNACGYTREIVHTFGNEWRFDQDYHWYDCTICGERTVAEVHVSGAEATVDNAQVCLICNYEIAPALEEEQVVTTAPPTEPPVPTAPPQVYHPGNMNIETPQFPWAVVMIVVFGMGLVAYMLLHKKKD